MSRAERRVVPPAPRLWATIKASAESLYYNSWRFLLANIIFGALLIVVLLVSAATPVGLLLVLLLVPAAAGLMRMATHLARERSIVFSEFTEPMRRRPWRVLGLGLAELCVALVLIVDLLIGLATDDLLGAFLTVSAIYALIGLWAYCVIAWPLVLDPLRDDEPVAVQLRLAGLLLLAHPLRMGVMAAVVGLIVLVSTILIAAIVTFALAFAWLVSAHYVLPAADRFQGRATLEVDD